LDFKLHAMKKELSKEKLDSILYQLSITPLASVEEMERRNALNPFHKKRTEEKGFRFQNVNLIHFSIENKNLNSLLHDITKGNTRDIQSIYTVEFSKGDFGEPHLDTNSRTTLSLVLEKNSIGGDLIIGDKNADLNKPGDYIIYDGAKTIHSVSKVTKGRRKSLIVFYTKKFKERKTLY